ncbi:sigma-70 family RNA polymerase sigma factor [Candidatus Poribacteria bacterium]|nr:sigma-70 family RNA polymerase sigma factor [Candidatus Poribacteria bacterium]
MERDDVQLIRSTLSGDDAAFNALVKKYQKGVHALAWRKIGDFHYAEEITQDTFLQVYKKLSTLKNPNQFAGWLYVIANRCCLNWMRKKRPAIQSLEGTSAAETERFSYNHYVSEQRETEASEHRSEIVKKLLARLPESERTVVTLYYLSEMTSKEIGKFLGVSVKTVHSRLHRARKRLQEKDEILISEVLGAVQLPIKLTEDIMRQVADMKPIGPPVAKPLLPWAAFGAATVLIILLLGASNQYLARFQKPYNFEAQSEPTIEIVEAPIVLDINAKPTIQNQVGRATTPGKNSSAGLQSTEIASTSNTQDNLTKFSASQWNRTNGPYGGTVRDIFVTSDKTLYAAAPTGIYRLTPDATAWTLINSNVRNGMYRTPMAEHDNALYIVSTDNIFTSNDNGKTWNILCSRPKGHPVGFIIVDEAYQDNLPPRIVMYLALQDKGIFRSTDAGVQWNLLKNGLAGKHIYAMAAIENTVFASTNEGLYRLNSDVWQQLQVNTDGPVYWIAGFENNLYIEVSHDSLIPEWLEFKPKQKDIEQLVFESDVRSNRIFHSTDFGASWTEITHENESEFMSPSLGMMFLANTGETLLPQGIVVAEKNTFYRASPLGIYRTTDSGKSWHPFMNGIIGTTIHDLVAVNDTLYVNTGRDFLQSVNGGETWETVRIDTNNQTLETIQQIFSYLNFASPLAVANDVLYGVVPEKEQHISQLSKDGIIYDKDHLRIFQLSMRDNVLVPVQEAPTFERESSFVELWTADHLPNNPKSHTSIGIKHEEIGGFAVTGQTFYAEWKRRLFKWKYGDPEWTDTGLIDNSEPLHRLNSGFKLAVSGDTVYVGKRDGKLFQSLDGGKSWKNITPTLPLHFTGFKQIVFAGTTVYVATDEGVLSSETGAHWQVLTDGMGAPTVINKFAVHHTSVYGADAAGIYRLDTRGKWEQISASVPDKIVSLAVSNDRLYIATQQRGIFHIPLEAQL